MSATKPFQELDVEAYYDNQSSNFLIPSADGDFIKCNISIMKNILKESYISPECGKDDMLSPLDERVNWLVKNRYVDYVGAVAGYRRGYHRMNGIKVLINKELNLIVPEIGDFDMVDQFFHDLLIDPDDVQLHYFYGWLKVALEGLYNEDMRKPGQALCIAGPVKCGKTFCQRVITELFGGVEAHPYQYLVGETSFNSDLFPACHLRIDDENRYTSHEARKNFGNFLKNSLYGKSVRCHAKGRTPVGMNPHWRLTIAINDNEENLLVLPEIKSDLEDKIILLKANMVRFPFDNDEDPKAQINYWKELRSQFPAFIHYLLHDWKIAPEFRNSRSGVNGYQNPELLQTVDSFTKEAYIMEMIDGHIWDTIGVRGLMGWGTSEPYWQGTAEQLKEILTDKYGYDAEKALAWRNAMGTILGNASKMADYKNRVSYSQKRIIGKMKRIWTIFNPNFEPSKSVPPNPVPPSVPPPLLSEFSNEPF